MLKTVGLLLALVSAYMALPSTASAQEARPNGLAPTQLGRWSMITLAYGPFAAVDDSTYFRNLGGGRFTAIRVDMELKGLGGSAVGDTLQFVFIQGNQGRVDGGGHYLYPNEPRTYRGYFTGIHFFGALAESVHVQIEAQ
jgi:hypothetical protein